MRIFFTIFFWAADDFESFLPEADFRGFLVTLDFLDLVTLGLRGALLLPDPLDLPPFDFLPGAAGVLGVKESVERKPTSAGVNAVVCEYAIIYSAAVWSDAKSDGAIFLYCLR